MILLSVVLKLNMQALLNPDFHLNRRVFLNFILAVQNSEFNFLHHIARDLPRDGGFDVIPQLAVSSCISLVRLVNFIERKRNRDVLSDGSWWFEFTRQGNEVTCLVLLISDV